MAEAEQAEIVAKLKQKSQDAVRKGKAAPSKKRFKGDYAGPDKYKGKIPEGYKGTAKGEYFGKDSRKGANVERKFKPAFHKPEKLPGRKPFKGGSMPVGYDEWKAGANKARQAGKSYIQGWKTQ